MQTTGLEFRCHLPPDLRTPDLDWEIQYAKALVILITDHCREAIAACRAARSGEES